MSGSSKSPFLSITIAEAAQPGLWPDPDDVSAGASDRYSVGQYTGERLAQADPERYRAIVRALANGMGIRSIARAWRVSPNTVAAVRAREGASIDTLKTELAGQAMLGAQLAVERIIDEIDHFKREALPIVAGVLVDKAQLLTGAATSIVGKPADGAQDWDGALEAIRQATGRTVEDTGLRAEDCGTKEGARAGLPVGTVEALPAGLGDGLASVPGWQDLTPAIVARDSESPDCLSIDGRFVGVGHGGGHGGHGGEDAGQVQGTRASASGQGAGGGSGEPGEQIPSMHPDAGNFETKETP